MIREYYPALSRALLTNPYLITNWYGMHSPITLLIHKSPYQLAAIYTYINDSIFFILFLTSAMLLQGYMYGKIGPMWQFTITPPLHAIIYNIEYLFRVALFLEVIRFWLRYLHSWGYVISTYDKLSDNKLRVNWNLW